MVLDNLLGGDSDSPENTTTVEILDLIGELKRQREQIEEEMEESDDEEGEEEESRKGEIEVPYTTAEIPHPASESILEAALERIGTTGAKEISRSNIGVVEDPSQEIQDPQTVVLDFNRLLQENAEELYDELADTKHEVDSRFRHLANEGIGESQPFPYVIAELDKGVIIGGAVDIVNNACDELGYSEVEREFVRLVYDEVVRRSDGLGDIQGHIVQDDVLVIVTEE